MLKVLLVEDEELIRRGLKFTMDWTSVECTVVGEASSGAEGLEKISELRPDIVITDVRMQDMDGLEMLRASIDKFGFSAIIISGHGNFEYAQQAIHLGVTEYLLKPIDLDELKTCILKIGKRRKGSASKPAGEQPKLFSIPEASNIKNRYAAKMLEHIKEHYAEHISLTELSQLLNVSCTHLNAKFKSETGYTFLDFLNYYRISRAVELQQQGDLKLYEIAERVGFSDYKYFNKVYKKYVGYAPINLSHWQENSTVDIDI